MLVLAHETLLGLKKAEAGSELVWRRQGKKHTKKVQKQPSTNKEAGVNTDEDKVQDSGRDDK